MAEHRRSAGLTILRLITAAGLAVDAYVHFDLASQYDTTIGGITQGLLFRIEAVAAILAALLVLASARRVFAVLPLLIAASALGAILLYRYVDVGTIGPLPDMYDPAWFPEKVLSAIAEAIATIGAAILLVAPRRQLSQPPS
jgi:hypothetical protein